MKKSSSRHVGLKLFLSILGSLFLVASLLQCVCFISNAIVSYTYYYNKVERKDLTSILNKEELTTEDYKIIYEQTGVTTYGVNRLMKDKEYGIFKLKAIQNAFLEEVQVENKLLGPYCYYQVTNHYMEMVPLKEGDIIISNATQFLGKTFGHAGLATSPSAILESYGYNEISDLGIKEDFTHRASFIVLSPRVDEKIKKEVAKYAENNLQGIPYNVFIGLFGTKNTIESTQCSHIVWYAYNHFGYDFDSDGGEICLPHDLLNLDLMDVVQVYGFDLYNFSSW